MENVKEIVDLLDGKMSNYKADLQKAVDEQNKKNEEQVKQLNEDLAAKGKTLGEIAETLKEVQAKQGRIGSKLDNEVKTFESEFGKAIAEKAGEIASITKGKSVDFKLEGVHFKTVGDMTMSANLTGSGVANYSTDPAIRGRRKVNFRDIPGVGVVNSSTGLWKFYRNNATAGEGSFGVQTQGSAKAQIDYDFTEVTVTIDTIAGFSRISRQMLRDLPFMQSFLPGELREDYFRAETNKFINTLMPQIAAYSTTASVYVEKLIEWHSVLLSRDYEPSAFVTSAANWATLLSTKPSNYSTPSCITVTPMGELACMGVPIVVCNGITGTKTLVGDFTKTKIAQATGLSVQFFEQDADNVTKNLVTVRAEADVALAALRTDAFIYE